MGAVGAMPAALVHLDDTLLEAQMCADSQETNTGQMLEAFARMLADGRIDHHDADEVLYVRRHVALEHELNREQSSLLRWARWATNNVIDLVQELRGRLQERRRAAGEAAPRMLPKQPDKTRVTGESDR